MELTDNLSDQSMRYGTVRLAVPPGFQNIIRLISHEVLREQPKDSIKFIADFLQDVLTIRENTGYDPVLQGELIQLVQAQYSQLRKDRRALSEQQVKRPVPPEGDETWGEAGGDAALATKKQATETVSTMVNDVIECVEESANQEAEIPEEETEPPVSPVQETESAPDESEVALLETESAPPETTEAQLETESAPPETTEAPLETESTPPETTEAPLETESTPPEITEAPLETESAPPEITEALLETESAPPEITEAPLETEAAPPDTTTEEEATEDVQPGTAEEVADSADEPAQAPPNTEEEPSTTVEEPSDATT